MKKIILTLLLTAGALGLTHANEWKSTKQSNGVEIYTKEVPGTALKAFKGVTRVKASMSSLIAMIEDIPEYKNWMYNIKTSNVVGETTTQNGVVYVVQKAPIITDRDICFEYKVSRSGDSVQVEFHEKPNGVPSTDYVRVQYFRGMFKLTPKGSDVEVVYEVAADPGGSVPSSVANTMAVDIPFTTLSNIHTKVNLAKYEGKNRYRYN